MTMLWAALIVIGLCGIATCGAIGYALARIESEAN